MLQCNRTDWPFWRGLIKQALALARTPFYLFSAEPVRQALEELRILGPPALPRPDPAPARPGDWPRDRAGLPAPGGPIPIRHWLSCKTQPIRPLLRWWRRQGLGIKVVSEFELQAALAEAYAPDQILVNGPAKHHWLPRHPLPGLRVNFDSRLELETLLPQAKALGWRVGVRCRTSLERDPETPRFPAQFGFDHRAAVAALQRLRRAGLCLETVHFHLRTNVPSPALYDRAIREVAALCRAAGCAPRYLDCGGGLPPRHTLAPDGRAYDARFDLAELARVFRRGLHQFPGLKELWLENGRFLCAPAGVLVVRVLEVKAGRGWRQVICDGGRALHALLSLWETHRLFPLPERRGRRVMTAVYGPTCMVFDQLVRRPLPATIRAGDYLVWMEAGAYHIPWETRFSHGLAPVLWHEAGRLAVARKGETFADWWGQWK